jgi:hypothetical protein
MSDKFANQIRNMAHEIVMEETKSMRNQLTAITAERDKLQAQVDCAEVSLNKFFDSEYSGDLCNMAVDAREIFCKVGDMLDKAEAQCDTYKRGLEEITSIFKGEWDGHDAAKDCKRIARKALQGGQE